MNDVSSTTILIQFVFTIIGVICGMWLSSVIGAGRSFLVFLAGFFIVGIACLFLSGCVNNDMNNDPHQWAVAADWAKHIGNKK
jgi:ABC-type transport system involved in multi-copper enzyme maturation permease subunit